MFPLTRWLSLGIVLTLGLLTAPAALAQGDVADGARDYIRDEGKFFDEATLRRANNEIHSMVRRYKREVRVETFAQIPPERAKEYKENAKKDFFNAWARERAEKLGVEGVYIL